MYSRYIPPSKKSSACTIRDLSKSTTIASSPRHLESGSNLTKPVHAQDVSTHLKTTSGVLCKDPLSNLSRARPFSPAKKRKNTFSETPTSILPSTPKRTKTVKAEEHAHAELATDRQSASPEDERHKVILEKREKSLRKAQKHAMRTAREAAENGTADAPRVEELQSVPQPLVPLPQPEPVPEPAAVSTFDALPAWLSQPIRVRSDASKSFESLGLDAEVIRHLDEKGYREAFSVQAASLPLLLLPNRSRIHDIVISAATGSGKTLAYALPVVQDLSTTTAVSDLGAVIVMPTRELVTQVRKVVDVCIDAFAKTGKRRLVTGIAMGSQNLQGEQSTIMRMDLKYDQEEYTRRRDARNKKWDMSAPVEYGASDVGEFRMFDDLMEDPNILPHHIRVARPKIDILITTPGRLVEHIKATKGFTLGKVKWLIIDEADKLLDQSFQQWRQIVMKSLPKDHTDISKVVLSATMTRDVGLLAALQLRSPRLIVLDSSYISDTVAEQTLDLPQMLMEAAVKVGDEGSKPLYLLKLLREQILLMSAGKDSSDSVTSSDGSSTSTSDDNEQPQSASTRFEEQRAGGRGVLIFTKSNENAVRLGRLVALMEPSVAERIGTLTSTVKHSYRKQVLRGFANGTVTVIIASDLVSRGLDLPNLAHVINYDLPTSLINYVHRVGRTARAGKSGHAWTLFTNSEGRWFWNEIARNALLKRSESQKVGRHNIDSKVFTQDEHSKYEAALQELGKEVAGSARSKASVLE